jgi:hypothetical protein
MIKHRWGVTLNDGTIHWCATRDEARSWKKNHPTEANQKKGPVREESTEQIQETPVVEPTNEPILETKASAVFVSDDGIPTVVISTSEKKEN